MFHSHIRPSIERSMLCSYTVSRKGLMLKVLKVNVVKAMVVRVMVSTQQLSLVVAPHWAWTWRMR